MVRWTLVGVVVLALGCSGKSRTTGADGGRGGSTMSGGSGSGGSGGSAGRGGAAGKGGSTGSGGSAGGGGSAGKSGNYVIGEIRQQGRSKVDLLVMLDNSSSMADKQRLLAEAIPVLVDRLVSPLCVDEQGRAVSRAPCPSGSQPELPPVEDLHLGVITSSLGDHGSGDICSQASATPETTYNDLAQLVPSVRAAAAPSWNASGFLVWDPRMLETGTTPHEPPGYGSPLAGSPGSFDDMVSAFEMHVAAAGERGCGHESQLESWYRFLVDPEPVGAMTNDGAVSVRGAVNQTVLAQRSQFLRPDSVLALVLLTDENDCSFLDEDRTQGWLAMYKGGPSANSWRMPRARSTCEDPNSADCLPCTQGDPDPACDAGVALTAIEDHPNLRCYRMKERFGIDLKYPISRYVDALTSPTIDPRFTGDELPNPIFAPGNLRPREPEDVVVLGIVGVPWQDLATDGTTPGSVDSLDPSSRDLRFMTAAELDASGRWDVILGDGSGPQDPFMVESVDPRPVSAHPFLPGVVITPPGGTLNDVNGTEQAVSSTQRYDLQFACTFPLVPPVPCTELNAQGCDCNADDAEQMSPLCEYPVPMMDGTQVRAKAYPSIRELELLRELGPNAVVASICPKNVEPDGESPQADPYYGYNPAITALAERLKESLAPRCLPRPLVATEGRVSCDLVQAWQGPGADSCACPDGSPTIEAALAEQLPDELRVRGVCGVEGVPCESFCFCGIPQLEGEDLASCQNDAVYAGAANGFCYVEEASGPGAQGLLAACPLEAKRLLRFTGANTPAAGSVVLLACN